MLVGEWLVLHGLPAAAPWADQHRAELRNATLALTQLGADVLMPPSAGRGDGARPRPPTAEAWERLGAEGRGWLLRLHKVHVVPDLLGAGDAADLWLSCSLVVSRPGTAAGVGVLGAAIIVMGRLGVGSPARHQELARADPAAPVPGLLELCRAAMRALDDSDEGPPLFPLAWRTARGSGCLTPIPLSREASARLAGQAFARQAQHQGKPDRAAGGRADATPGPGRAEAGPLQPDEAAPEPTPRADGLEGVQVAVRETSSVWMDLVAETDLWRRFEVVDPVPREALEPRLTDE